MQLPGNSKAGGVDSKALRKIVGVMGLLVFLIMMTAYRYIHILEVIKFIF